MSGSGPAGTMAGSMLALWLDGSHDAPANMARDAALLDRATSGSFAGPVMRLFGFDPPGITLGRAQRPEAELDLSALERDGVRWATRPTGGRAIWHEQEWTFSLVTRLGPGEWAESPAAAYERTSRLLAGALGRLGVPARLAPGSARGPGGPRAAQGAAPPCFASTARHELVADGRKLAGIAQRLTRGVLLQQGSLLLGDSHVRLAEYVRVSPGEREELREQWRAGAAVAGRWIEGPPTLERFALALAEEIGPPMELLGGAGARRLGVPELPRP